MKIAILGAAGRMGKWFTQYFAEKGYPLTISGINQEKLRALAKNYGAKVARNNQEAVEDADLTLVSVPIGKTAEVLREITPKLKQGSIVSEIASVKSGIIDVLRESSKSGVQPLSLHPLFGPMQKAKKKFVLVPVLNPESELAVAKRFFPDAEIVVVDAEKHDRAMAVTLSLQYFVNMAFASAIKDEDFKTLEKLSGTTFTLQQVLIGAIMMHDSELHASLHMANKYSPEYLRRFVLNAEKIRKLIESGDTEAFQNFYNEINKGLSKTLDLAAMYEKMYAILEVMEKGE
ncbi:MAG: prephenate dehydrogenase/arogenate dehydrogenase family protein [Candidatus Bathyarchaeia archaeon]